MAKTLNSKASFTVDYTAVCEVFRKKKYDNMLS
jgi:hypothetical protein